MKTTKSSGNVFADIGFDEIEAEELAVKADFISLIAKAIRRRNLTQAQAAKICGTEQPTLSKALNGRLESLTIDRLAKWFVALGGRVRIDAKQPKRGARGSISVQAS